VFYNITVKKITEEIMAKKKKEGGFWSDFKNFISRGNVVDMAVGVVIGTAFSKIVTGFVNYIINPFIGVFMPNNGGLDSIKTVIRPEVIVDGVVTQAETAILWGTWLQTIIDFLITALCIFLVIRAITKLSTALKAKELAEKAEAEKAAAEKAAEEQKALDEANAKKAAEDKALRESLIKQEKLLEGILKELKKD
jgi:large conductance mechanosensitive channel